MMLRVGRWFVALLVCLSAGRIDAQEAAKIPQDKTKFHLFLLVGQSNMAGRGKIDDQSKRVHPRIWMFNRDQLWVPAVDPLHFDKPAVIGTGLGKTFAEDYAADHPDVSVGLIPCAAGGSPISSWQPGGYHSQTESHPYEDTVRRATRALETGQLKGILWHQGESDSRQPAASVYESKLHELIDRLRKDLDVQQVPFIAGQMGRFAERPWNAGRRMVDQAHRRLPDRVPLTAFVSSYGLDHKGDQVHFDTESYRQLAHRYYAAFVQLTGGDKSLQFELDRNVAHQGFDGQTCWVHARAGAIPRQVAMLPRPLVVMTTQRLQLSGSDVFYALNETRSRNGGQSWSDLERRESFARVVGEDGREVTVCDFVPKWHAASGKLLGTGQTVWYENNQVMKVRPRATAYAVYDVGAGEWSPWQRLEMPAEPRFANAGAGSVQRFDLPDGQLLLPIYFKEPEQKQFGTTVCRCSFDGEKLEYVEHGSELTVNVKRGLYEPSITQFQDRYYLTMRNDDDGYVAVSDDGLSYGEVHKWRFDDGSALGNYNTQQHWVTHSDGLFLVYTRRGADNDHVFRHRAPLFMARVDPERLCVIRSTEQILVPQQGARLGNFGVVEVSPAETWVTVTEWMQPIGVEKYGSDNRIYVVKLKWDRPNRLYTE